jgi:hypothetical protein
VQFTSGAEQSDSDSSRVQVRRRQFPSQTVSSTAESVDMSGGNSEWSREGDGERNSRLAIRF